MKTVALVVAGLLAASAPALANDLNYHRTRHEVSYRFHHGYDRLHHKIAREERRLHRDYRDYRDSR